jgi:C4-dicarboxylate-specific signal transduction histidine kinase
MRFPNKYRDPTDSKGPTETAKESVLKNRFLRNILIVAIIIIIALISYNMFFTIPSFTHLLINTTKDDAVRITRHLASYLLISEKKEIGKHSLNIQLLKEVGQIKEDFELMNLKVFSPSGEIVFSGYQNEVGEINQRRYFQDIVAKGKVYAEVVPKNKESLEGRKVTSDVLETYVPLMNDGRFLGAFEIYYDITDRKKQLDKLISETSTITFMFASGLLIAIILMLYQENLSMKKRRQLEEERLRRERLEGVIEMAGAACHELAQPLQSLSVYSHLLLTDLSEDSPLFGEMKKVQGMVNQLGQITKKIMHITRYETKEYIEGYKIIDIDKASS